MGCREPAAFARDLAPQERCRRGMHAPSRTKKPELPPELHLYWNRRLFERRERDYT